MEGGNLGYCPDWYATIKAAHYYGAKPWELIDCEEHWHRHACWVVWADWAQSADAELRLKHDAAMRGMG